MSSRSLPESPRLAMKLWLATEQAVTAQYARNHDRRPGELNGADLDQSRMDPPQHALRVLLDRV